MNEFLFSYGTLQRHDVQLSIFGKILEKWDDVLAGYRLVETDVTDPVFLARGEFGKQFTLLESGNSNDRTPGVALEVTMRELALADNYEPANYERVKVTLESGRTAWVYVAG